MMAASNQNLRNWNSKRRWPSERPRHAPKHRPESDFRDSPKAFLMKLLEKSSFMRVNLRSGVDLDEGSSLWSNNQR